MWHALDPEQVLDAFDTGADGLTTDAVEDRFRQNGPNILPEEDSAHPLRRFLRQFHNPVICFLITAACAALALGHPVDAVVIMIVVVVNAIVGFVQEGCATIATAAERHLHPLAVLGAHG